jgi:hypothetical protein
MALLNAIGTSYRVKNKNRKVERMIFHSKEYNLGWLDVCMFLAVTYLSRRRK